MDRELKILVAAGESADGENIVDILHQDFNDVALSVKPEDAVADFDATRPSVLVLAFKSIEEAEGYYLRLYRGSTTIHEQAHRSILLCFQADLRRAYTLCLEGHFDDYVQFWPGTHDPCRLLMATHHCRRALYKPAAGQPSASRMAAQVGRVAELEGLLDSQLTAAAGQVDASASAMARSAADVRSVFTRLYGTLSEKGLTNEAGLPAPERLLEEVDRGLRGMGQDLQPIRQWMEEFKSSVAPHLESMRDLKALAAEVRPLILVVDDDEFQRKLLDRMLLQLQLETMHAGTGMEAFSRINDRQPDLILMDVGLPGISGIEITRRIKHSRELKHIPIIVITGNSNKSTVEGSLRAGAVDFMVKPVAMEVLKPKIEKQLKRLAEKPRPPATE